VRIRFENIRYFRSDKKCATTVSPAVRGLTITPTDWRNLYFKEHITIVDLSGITVQI